MDLADRLGVVPTHMTTVEPFLGADLDKLPHCGIRLLRVAKSSTQNEGAKEVFIDNIT